MPKPSMVSLPASLSDPVERTAFLAIAGSVSLTLVSIAASQILLATAIAATAWHWIQQKKVRPSVQPFLWPLVAFCLWTLLAICFSRNVHFALLEAKKFFLYTLLLLVPTVVRRKGAPTWIYYTIFSVAVLSCFKGISQFISNPNRGLLDRISGFMSQWMTYSGLLMLVLVALAAFIATSGWRKHRWALPLSLLLAVPLYLSETRNAQLGAAAGILAVLLLLRRWRAIAGLVVIVLIVYFVSPLNIRQRLRAGFDPADPNTRNRIELFGTALRLIEDNPWIGVGPKNVQREALRYRGSSEWPGWMYQHMHNNFLQIAAERGIPGLFIWMWLMGRLAWDALRVVRSAGGLPAARQEKVDEALTISMAALGAWAAMIVAGMFEYNFGDSEVLTLFLFMMGAPYCFLHGAPTLNEH